ncbi:MAG: hypothetical protein HGA42_19030 [Nostocales cyanobacterium W4_Combined_metabat2_030]|nr:hypothetical protein [Nostocales cyanobacterium W4_Combined_metabat2_030]
MKNKNKIKYNGGAAMIIVVFFFMFISLTILIGVVTPVIREFRIASDNFDSKQSYFIAESGIEDMMYRVKNSMDVGTIGVDRTLYLNDSFVSVPTELTDLGGGQKQITATGGVNYNERTVNLVLTTATGVSFNYGVLVGQGGIELDGSGTINGNIYANGPITGDSSSVITGTAISANSPASSADQINGVGTPTNNIVFGNANATQDIAQSFRTSALSPLNKIQLYIKKTGAPSNAIVKIMNDSSGNIGTTMIASGALSASSVTTSYGWVEVSFTTNPLLDVSKTYWLVIDASTGSGSKCYTLGASNGNVYANGISKIGRVGSTWSNTTPSGLDYFFKLYLGGINGSITGNSGSQWNPLHVGTISGSAQAHTVNYVNATGNIYCKSGTGNNKTCIDQPDPAYIAYPVSEANMTEWETDASSGGTYAGNYIVGYAGATIGPKKIAGNLTVSGGGILTVTGNLWVTGNIILNGGGRIRLASSYGSNDGVVMADGTITVSGGGQASGSGTAGSYLMLLSRSDLTTAMSISGGAGAVIAYAPYGTITISGGAALKEATGYKMLIEGGSSITYESGLTNNNFSSGPSGTWGIDSWGETE